MMVRAPTRRSLNGGNAINATSNILKKKVRVINIRSNIFQKSQMYPEPIANILNAASAKKNAKNE